MDNYDYESTNLQEFRDIPIDESIILANPTEEESVNVLLYKQFNATPIIVGSIIREEERRKEEEPFIHLEASSRGGIDYIKLGDGNDGNGNDDDKYTAVYVEESANNNNDWVVVAVQRNVKAGMILYAEQGKGGSIELMKSKTSKYLSHF